MEDKHDHYAVIIPVESFSTAQKVLACVLSSGLGAIIEKRGDNHGKL